MKENRKGPDLEKLKELFAQYRYVLLIIAAGVLLLAWPTGDDRAAATQKQEGLTGGEEDFSVAALEQQLEEILSKVEGAGDVSVMLTVQSGMERVLATDRLASRRDSQSDVEQTTVLISTQDGEEAVLITQRYPTFQGAVIVCRGGDDPQVQLLLSKAVSALTGLGTDRITVCKGS